MSGTINLALSQQFDMDGAPLSGGLLQFFTAGTTTPQTPFQDTALTIPHPNPIILDASGRVPMFYLADGFIKISLKDKNGVVVIAADQLLVIGPSSGASAGAGVDPNTVLQTGDIKARYGTGTLTGFARCNGNTIGATGSSATELAGPSAQALYEYLWPFATTLDGGAAKGANAVADFGALKRLILPDLRGRTIAGMDDMGAAVGPASRLTAAGLGVGITGIVLGNAGGLEKLTSAQIVGHTHNLRSNALYGGLLTISTEQDFAGTSQDHTHGWGSLGAFSGGINGVNGRFQTYGSVQAGYDLNHTHVQDTHAALGGVSGGGGAVNDTGQTGTNNTGNSSLGTMDHAHNIDIGGTTSGRNPAHYHSINGTTENNNSSVTAQPNVPPTMVMTIYIKL